MTEMEKTIIKKFIDDKTLLFYGCYVDNTLVVIKGDHLKLVQDTLNNFDKNLNFTVDTFSNVVPHFLDIEIHPDGLTIYWKDTNTGQYTHYNSFPLWHYKTSWVSSLVHWAVNICDKNKLQAELTRIKDLVAWNSFLKRIRDAVTNNKLRDLNVNNMENTSRNEFETIWIKIPYLGDTGDQLLKLLKTKLKHRFTKEVKFRIIQFTQKLSFYTNMKDRIPKLMKSYVVYQFNCPDCNELH